MPSLRRAAAAVLLGALAVPAMADSLPITFTSQGREDTSPLTLNYTYVSPTLGELSIKGTNTIVSMSSDGGQTFTSKFGIFDIEAVIDPTLGTAVSGSVSLQTYVTGKTGATQTIWSSSTLTAFGNTASFGELDFQFIQSGASILSGIQDGSAFAIEVFQQGQYSATPAWTTSFSGAMKNDGGGDAAPVPSTALAGVVLLSLAGMAVGAQRRRFLPRGLIPLA